MQALNFVSVDEQQVAILIECVIFEHFAKRVPKIAHDHFHTLHVRRFRVENLLADFHLLSR